MVRAVFLHLLIIFCAGCPGQPKIPVDIYLDSKWDLEEATAIIYGMKRWEEASDLHFFNFVGVHNDHSFTSKDMFDEKHVIYKLTDSANAEIAWLEERIVNQPGTIKYEHSTAGGYGMHSDILIFSHRFRSVDRPTYLIDLEDTLTHEVGHFLGLGHNMVQCNKSMMAPDSCASGTYRIITKEDVKQLCVFYDCP